MEEITLYSRNNAGNILIWECTVINKNETCSLYISRGLLFGEKTISYEHNIVGKQGRTHYEQAQSRLISRANKKKRAGYIEFSGTDKETIKSTIDSKNLVDYLESLIPKYREDAEGNAKPMKAAQYYRSAKDKTKDENGKVVTLPYWTDPTGKQWKDRKYYYIY